MIPIIDMHQDLRMHIDCLYPYPHPEHKQTSFQMLEEANVKLVYASGYPCPPEENHFDPTVNDLIESDLEYYRNYTKENNDWMMIQSKGDLETLFSSEEKRGILFHIEGLNAFTGTDKDWKRVDSWYEKGLRSVGIVWNLHNQLGGGAHDNSVGLTELGKEFIEWCQEKHIIVDCAHMNEKTFYDAAEILHQPIVITHGNTRKISDHPRNFSDEELMLMAESGGVTGLFFAPRFVRLEGRASVDDVILHIDHLRELVGIDHIALGTDFGGIVSERFIEGLSNITDVHLLFQELSRKGYGEEDIEKIAWKNAFRVLNDILS